MCNEKKEIFAYVKNSFTEKQIDAIGACGDAESSKTIVEITVDTKTCKEIDKKPLF